MSEINAPIQFRADHPSDRPRSVGRVRLGVDVRLVDEHDTEVGDDEPGELVIRADRPWEMAIEYLNNPAATAVAWRNGWFHTGDRLRRDEDGYFYFVDRMKDVIRRSGENISSFEVEAEVLSHPAILECAALATPDERRGEEVRVVVVLKPGASLSAPDLLEFLRDRLSAFALPRYVEFVQQLPKTENGKILKAQLRSEGLPAGTWDRETVAHGPAGGRP
jgi:crotonobetaine/carnitine-CoA ligase